MSGASSELSMIPPSEYGFIPSLPPPLGTQSNFINPENKGPAIFTVTTVFLVLMLLFVFARTYTKAVILKSIKWDDFTLLLAMIGCITFYVAITWSTIKGPVGKHQWDVPISDTLTMNFFYPSYINNVTPIPTLGLAKLTLFILYYQLFWPMRWARWAIWVGFILTLLFYGASTILQFIFSSPKPGQTWAEHFTSPEERHSLILSIPVAVFGMLIDIYLIVVPLKAVMQLQISKEKKIGIGLIFLTGILAFVASVLSLYYRVLLYKSDDETWGVADVELMIMIEMYVGIIVACMPSVGQLARRYLPGKDLSFLSSRLSPKFGLLRSWTSNNSHTNKRSAKAKEQEGAVQRKSSHDKGFIRLYSFKASSKRSNLFKDGSSNADSKV